MFPKIIKGSIPQIPGLLYYNNFITPSQKSQMINIINKNKWCGQLKRKQQYYGIKYFQTKYNDPILQSEQSSDFYQLSQFQSIINRLIDIKIFDKQYPPNQCLVNNYINSTVLKVHLQDTNAFGQIICGLSIGSPDYLRLQNIQDSKIQYRLKLQDMSIYVLKGQARHKWKHGIARTIFGQKYKQQDFNRISFTFRHVLETRRKVKQENLII